MWRGGQQLDKSPEYTSPPLLSALTIEDEGGYEVGDRHDGGLGGVVLARHAVGREVPVLWGGAAWWRVVGQAGRRHIAAGRQKVWWLAVCGDWSWG